MSVEIPLAKRLDVAEHRFFATPRDGRSVSALLRTQASCRPAYPFLRTPGGTWTFAEVDEWVDRVAVGLATRGVKQGDSVLIMVPNCAEFVVAWFAVNRLGAVQVGVNTAYKGALLEHVVENSGAQTIVVATTLLARFDIGRAPFDQVRRVVGIGTAPADTSLPEADYVDFADLADAAEPPQVDGRHSDTAGIVYSSGTTGASKGIVLSNNYFWFHGTRTAVQGNLQPDDVLYTCLPLFHGNAQGLTVMPALIAGVETYVDSAFTASRFWDRMRASRATRFNYIGGMIPILMSQDPRDDDRDHRVRFALGAAAPRSQLEAFEDRFGVHLIEVYGQTENGVALVNPTLGGRAGSVGRPLAGFDVELVDADDEPVADGEVGEMVFRPQHPHIMMERYNRMPEETVALWRNLWCHSGDLMRRDEDGFHYFVDRKKDAMRRRGENISAAEVEIVVNSHPAVLESAAIPVPSAVGEDEVMVFVVVRDRSTFDPLDLIKHCDAGMAYFAVPRYVEVVDYLPKTPTERVEKYRLRERGVSENTWDREDSGYVLTR